MAVKFNVESKRGETFFIRPSEIVRDEKNRGRPFGTTDQEIDNMAESLKREGQIQPIVIRKLADGTPCLVAGYTRHEAGLKLEKADDTFRLKCIVHNGNEDDAFRDALTENAVRNELSDMQHAINHEEARRRGIFATETEIASFYGRNAAWVSRLKKLLLLPTSLQKKVHSGEISSHAGRLLAELPAEQQQEAVKTGAVQVTDLEEMLRKQQPPAPLNTVLRALDQREEAESSGSTEDAAPLDFSNVQPNGTRTPAVARRTRQRNLTQVKTLLKHYTCEDTHVVLKTFATILLAYTAGEVDETEFEKVICEMEGRDKKTAVPVKVKK